MPFTAKDVKDVACLVSCKLETYINNERRELSFDPSGRPTVERHPMWQYDTFPRLFKHVTCDTAKSRERRLKSSRKHKPSGVRSDIPIDPVIMVKSLKSVPPIEAACIVAYANDIFKCHQIDRLQEVLAFKPSLTQADPKPGHETPQNYTCHVGSCLKSDHYANFYQTYGLRSGKCRLKPIPKSEQKIETQKEHREHQNKFNVNQNEQKHVYQKSNNTPSQTKCRDEKLNSRYEACRASLMGLLLEETKHHEQQTSIDETQHQNKNHNLRHDHTREVGECMVVVDDTASLTTLDHNATDEEKEINTDEQNTNYDLAYFEEVFKS